MNRVAPLLVASLLLSTTSACSVAARNHRHLGMAADATAVTGAIIVATLPSCENRDASLQGLVDEAGCGAGNLVMIGLATGLVAMSAILGVAAIALPPSDPVEAPRPIVSVGGALGAPARAPTPMTDTIPLPAGQTDDLTVRLAFQVWRTASRGDCDATRVTLERLSERDPAYGAQLSLNAMVAGCLQ